VKTAFLFPEKSWPSSRNAGFSLFTSSAPDFCFESTFKQEGQEEIISSYAIGDKAVDLADEPDDKLAIWLSKDLSDALGVEKAVRGTFLKRKAWQNDKCIGGAYSFYRPGQRFNVRSRLQRRHQRVFFFGEHLSEQWQGFMEVAIETGEAAAEAL
jgi:monoamine oxidase